MRVNTSIMPLIVLASGSYFINPKTCRANPIGKQITRVEARLDSDPTFTKLVHIETTANTTAAAQAIAAFRVAWTDKQKLDILEAYTRKADGSVVQSNPADFVVQDGVAGPAMSFADLKIKQISFRDVSPGDTTVLVWRLVEQEHFFPGLVSEFLPVPPAAIEQEIDYRLDTPASLQITHSEREMEYRESRTRDRIQRHWSGRYFIPQTDEQGVVDAIGHAPSFGFSTYQSYDQLGEAYQKGVSQKLVMTPKFHALADEITKGASDPRAQATAIFDWITNNVRYVAVYFGTGRFIPNDLETILARRFGDCKDHALLMTALLNAKGIESEHVLINVQRSEQLPSVPVLPAFNHVMVYVPSLDAYADPTVPTSAFGTPPSRDLDSPIVRVSERGVIVTRTPAGRADENRLELETQIRLAADGSRQGETKVSATGGFAEKTRVFVSVTEAQGNDGALSTLARQQGFAGDLQLNAPSSTDHSEPYELRTSWKVEHAPSIVQSGWRAPPGLSPIWANPAAFFGPVGLARRRFPVGCMPGKIHQIVQVALPSGVRPKEIPNPVKIDTGQFGFTRHWAFKDGVLLIETGMKSSTTSRVCSPDYVRAVVTSIENVSNDIDPVLKFVVDVSTKN